MRDTRLIMGMPITVEIADVSATRLPAQAGEALEKVFAYFTSVDERFSTYKNGSEIMRINRGEIPPEQYSPQMREVFSLAEKTKQETNGYFDIKTPGRLPAGRQGSLDPSGIVKGWAIQRAAELLLADGYTNFFVDAGGDIQSRGTNADGGEWSVGIRNPFNAQEIVKVVYPRGSGVATSGTYIRGQHIYDPHAPEEELKDIVSLTVIGRDVLDADRIATGAFAMGREGINFIEQLDGFEGYAIDSRGTATMTSGFDAYTKKIKL